MLRSAKARRRLRLSGAQLEPLGPHDYEAGVERGALRASSRYAVPLLCGGSAGGIVSISGGEGEDERWGRQ